MKSKIKWNVRVILNSYLSGRLPAAVKSIPGIFPSILLMDNIKARYSRFVWQGFSYFYDFMQSVSPAFNLFLAGTPETETIFADKEGMSFAFSRPASFAVQTMPITAVLTVRIGRGPLLCSITRTPWWYFCDIEIPFSEIFYGVIDVVLCRVAGVAGVAEGRNTTISPDIAGIKKAPEGACFQ